MVYDEYFINIETGEILTGTQAIHDFYTVEKHNILDAWTDIWKATGEQAPDVLNVPNFAECVKL